MATLHSNEKHTHDLIRSLHQLTKIPLRKLESYSKTNNIMNVLEHPLTIVPTASQLQKIEQLNSFLRSYHILSWAAENDKQIIRSPEQAGHFFSAYLKGMKDHEQFMVAFLDTSNRIIETRTFSEGGLNYSYVNPRNVLQAALYCDCASLILAHNHPGGSRNPSPEDIQLTQRIVDIFSPLNIQVLDHIIVAGNSYVSLAEKGNLPRAAENSANYDVFPFLANEPQNWVYQQENRNTPDYEEEWER